MLSNGKKYYVTTRDYGNEFKKKAEVPEIYLNKIIEFIGKDYDIYTPNVTLKYFYSDNSGNIIPVKTIATYIYEIITFGISGDEASGIKFSSSNLAAAKGGNRFEFIDNKFQKINK